MQKYRNQSCFVLLIGLLSFILSSFKNIYFLKLLMTCKTMEKGARGYYLPYDREINVIGVPIKVTVMSSI